MKIANSNMKIANSYENCKRPRRNYRPKRENCKLIWKLQTDVKIANWYENCKATLTFRCIVPTWTFAIFIWDTAGMKTCSGTEECFGSIAVWMTKTQQNILSQNLPRFIFQYQFLCWQRSLIHILSHDSSALSKLGAIHCVSWCATIQHFLWFQALVQWVNYRRRPGIRTS
jgi:hypothetical protein